MIKRLIVLIGHSSELSGAGGGIPAGLCRHLFITLWHGCIILSLA